MPQEENRKNTEEIQKSYDWSDERRFMKRGRIWARAWAMELVILQHDHKCEDGKWNHYLQAT